ncbi:intracellular sulfur oxidation DsrE/DsrF family protein [Agrococcus sp. UYP33]
MTPDNIALDTPAPVGAAAQIVFGSLADQGMKTMTDGGVEFVLCASALTAQM